MSPSAAPARFPSTRCWLTRHGISTSTAGGGTIDTNSFNSTFTGAFTGTAGLTKIGTSTLILTGAGGFAGPINVNAGILKLTTSNNVAGSSGVVTTATATVQLSNNITV